jgi:lysophospholipase L1-like esterase
MKYPLLMLTVLFAVMAFTMPAEKPVTLWLIGDSTMADKQVKAYPEAGWGMPFRYFFDSSIKVDNRAKNGRSTKTFLAEGLWKPVMDEMKTGDYVFIQFGHNDEVKTKKSYSTPQEFTANLERYISETRSRKAIPVLLTPVARRRFDSTGQLVSTHEEYSELVRRVAREQDVPLIDLDRKSQELLKEMGFERSKYLFVWLEPGEHPNYPSGAKDDTHFNELGARKMAQIVLASIRELKLPLADRIVRPVKK